MHKMCIRVASWVCLNSCVSARACMHVCAGEPAHSRTSECACWRVSNGDPPLLSVRMEFFVILVKCMYNANAKGSSRRDHYQLQTSSWLGADHFMIDCTTSGFKLHSSFPANFHNAGVVRRAKVKLLVAVFLLHVPSRGCEAIEKVLGGS